MSIGDDKQAIRDKVWGLLEREQAVPSGSHGKIPSFEGAERTAALLGDLDIWQQARTVKANPDHAQLPVRVRALKDGKLVYMAVPRMATLKPFYKLSPEELKVPPEEAADKRGAQSAAPRVAVSEMSPIDIVICGSVAVNRSGTRIGKGAGYSDLEVALLIEAGLITDSTIIVAPVHHLQVIEDQIPETDHDFSVDLIVTPDEVIPCSPRRRPTGLVRSDLTPDIVEAIPALGIRAEDLSS
ncbi:5-formyltetrahydrofolate cyclo-ligase [Actinoplanes lutulentus]|uniref:5-formyltetrahydrofolate cyclo-ligase n=1 Tax=Actinoplanes lutulentus TaxID=1287878 RepID=A0A327Z1B9_9ACTN|nr:5-formyltetrahydrofolate cyclo-ligase [Actinoplanes lutulentus]MBB2943272.1 5-formyltetrahydrofolate cyclo-ligase [Actinoplanes lutulentus]RAK28332.1 5-formyltetrahydrofolate cyclo-ligase [Actinoplanes lutulentus]